MQFCYGKSAEMVAGDRVQDQTQLLFFLVMRKTTLLVLRHSIGMP